MTNLTWGDGQESGQRLSWEGLLKEAMSELRQVLLDTGHDPSGIAGGFIK